MNQFLHAHTQSMSQWTLWLESIPTITRITHAPLFAIYLQELVKSLDDIFKNADDPSKDTLCTFIDQLQNARMRLKRSALLDSISTEAQTQLEALCVKLRPRGRLGTASLPPPPAPPRRQRPSPRRPVRPPLSLSLSLPPPTHTPRRPLPPAHVTWVVGGTRGGFRASGGRSLTDAADV